MRKILNLAVFSTAIASSVSAATLGLEVVDNPEISAAGTALNFPGVLDFIFTASGGSSTAPAAETGLDVSLTAAFQSDGSSTGFGALNVGSAFSGLFLAGLISDVGFVINPAGEDQIELLYSISGGSSAPEFGSRVLAVLTGEFGASASDLFVTGFTAPASVTINPVASPIPVPASLPLLAAAWVLTGVVHRRRRRY